MTTLLGILSLSLLLMQLRKLRKMNEVITLPSVSSSEELWPDVISEMQKARRAKVKKLIRKAMVKAS